MIGAGHRGLAIPSVSTSTNPVKQTLITVKNKQLAATFIQ